MIEAVLRSVNAAVRVLEAKTDLDLAGIVEVDHAIGEVGPRSAVLDLGIEGSVIGGHTVVIGTVAGK